MSGSIGLKRGRVAVVPYAVEWEREFAAERHLLDEALGDFVLGIEHVGSTAVDKSYAKPIIDIAIAVLDWSRMSEVSEKLTYAGYTFESNAGSDGGYIFMKGISGEIMTHHVHIVESHDPQWRNYLSFRDALIRDSSLREAYTELKIALGKRYPADRESYTASKIEFIEAALADTPSSAVLGLPHRVC